MGRQMFANGGAAFPDLSGDGNVTQKDILIGRGVIPMQDGGMAPMPAPAAPGPQMMPPGLPAIDPGSVDINEAAQGAMQQGINPAELEGMLTQYASQMDDIENAEDYETVINGIRGDTAPIEQRYQELAQVVGPEDSQATPESVLTLLQPVMQIAAVDQGIGGLAAEEMSAPIEGAMAEGIMSTVNMGAPEAPAQVPGGPAPVNFNQGGPVAYMQAGGDPRLGQIYQDKQKVYGDILGMADQEAELADQKSMTQAQMLFDVAQGALMFATPGERNMSPAERLAQSFQPVLGNISARAGDLQKFKQSQKKEKRALNLSALGAAENQLAFELKVDADNKAMAAEQAWKSGERAEDRAHELLKMDRTFAFNKEENESNQSFQMRLANRKIEAQDLLQRLQGAQSQSDIALRGRLQNELAQINNAFQRTMQSDRFDFTTSERLDTQGYQDAVREQQFTNQQALIALEFDNSQQSILLKDRLQKENDQLAREFTKTIKTMDFENVLQRDGILNGYELGRMDYGHDLNLALQDHNAAIAKEARLSEQVFEASERALERAYRTSERVSSQDFEKALRVELKGMDFEQADIDREIARINRGFDEALALRGADQKDTSLLLQERAQTLDEVYKAGMLSLEEQALNAVKVGSDAKTNTLSFLTNPERLTAYAEDSLGDETALFEQALNDYVKPSYTWNGTSFVKTAAPGLARQITDALNTRVANGYEIPNIAGYTASKANEPQGGNGTDALNTGTLEVGSTEFKQGLYNTQTGVQYDSPLWEQVPLNIVDREVAYQRATGPAEITTRIANVVTEYGREILGLPAMSAENRELVTASKDMDNLREKINQELINWQDDRVLKTTQDALRNLARDLTPGTFKSDEAVSATLDAIKGQMGSAFEKYAKRDPLINPAAEGKFDQGQITAARARTDEITSLMAEVIAMENIYNQYLETLTPGGPQGGTSNVNSARQMINEMVGK